MGKSLKKTKYIQLQKSHAEKMSLRGHRIYTRRRDIITIKFSSQSFVSVCWNSQWLQCDTGRYSVWWKTLHILQHQFNWKWISLLLGMQKVSSYKRKIYSWLFLVLQSKDLNLCRYQFHPKPPSPRDKPPRHDLKGAKTLPLGQSLCTTTPKSFVVSTNKTVFQWRDLIIKVYVIWWVTRVKLLNV